MVTFVQFKPTLPSPLVARRERGASGGVVSGSVLLHPATVTASSNRQVGNLLERYLRLFSGRDALAAIPHRISVIFLERVPDRLSRT